MLKDEHQIWWIFFVLGIGSMLPWNFFIIPYQYWMEKFDDGNSTINSFQLFWASSFVVTTNGTTFVMSFVTATVMSLVPRKIRFYVPIFGIASCFGGAALMSQYDSAGWVESFFYVTLAIAIVISIFSAVYQASLFGHAAELGGVMIAVLSGQGAGGVFACVTDIIAKLTIDDLPSAVCMYFLIAVKYLVLNAALFKRLQSMNLYKRKLEKPPESEPLRTVSSESPFHALRTTVWPYQLTLFLTFVVTVSVYPGVIATYRSVHFDESSIYHTKYFTTIWVFLNFAIFDFAGNTAALVICKPGSKWNIIRNDQPYHALFMSVARILFIPVLLKCNIEKDMGTVYFNSDVFFIITVAFFAFSHGLLTSIGMKYGPQQASKQVRERVGGYLGSTIVLGLLCGGCVSFGVVKFGRNF